VRSLYEAIPGNCKTNQVSASSPSTDFKDIHKFSTDPYGAGAGVSVRTGTRGSHQKILADFFKSDTLGKRVPPAFQLHHFSLKGCV
jgi:hypothetical protein